MSMKNLFITLFITMLSFNVNAEQAFSKALIQQYFNAVKSFEVLEQKNPDLEKHLAKAMMMDKDETVKYIATLPEFSQIQKISQSAGFENVEEFVDIGYRVAGSMFDYQINNMPSDMSLETMTAQMKTQIEMMQQNGMPTEMINEMQFALKEQAKSMEFMKKAASQVSEADKKFVRDNINWFMELMPLEADLESSTY